jgi:cellulose synthase/poly-beta-1,6-N-acetylglucosamine synthase-like glycosyltransferase
MEVVFWSSVGAIALTYGAYPLLLKVAALCGIGRAVRRAPTEPLVTLLISAYNEAPVIAQKLENTLALDYPRERLQIVVISDASSDETDAIVRTFAARGIELLRMNARGGKTLGLNAAVARARSDVIVFSDANAMYVPAALRSLVRNFADPTVGAVTGQQRYVQEGAGQSAASESLYWRYESAIKRLESAVGSVVGGDGAIYALRRELYRPMGSADLSDFVNPLGVVALGYRNVYEPEAVCVEHGGETFEKEFRRKVRIVNRAWRALLGLRGLMNPFRFGVVALQLIVHKLIRWLVPVFMLLALASSIYLALASQFFRIVLAAQLLFYALALIGWLRSNAARLSRIFYVPYYFCLVNLASLVGIMDNYRGKTYATWKTAREQPPQH